MILGTLFDEKSIDRLGRLTTGDGWRMSRCSGDNGGSGIPRPGTTSQIMYIPTTHQLSRHNQVWYAVLYEWQWSLVLLDGVLKLSVTGSNRDSTTVIFTTLLRLD
jgi:hypothetical protein